MTSVPEVTGFAASALVLATFTMKDMRLLRAFAILSNIAFMTYGVLDWLMPVLFLHVILLPLNIARLLEMSAEETGGMRRINVMTLFKDHVIALSNH